MYQRMDLERLELDQAEHKAAGGKGEFHRLMPEEEVPDRIKAPPEVFDKKAQKEAEIKAFGRGARVRKEVIYSDEFADQEFLRLVCRR